MIGYLKKLIPFAILIALILFVLKFFTAFKEVMLFAWICYCVFLVFSIVSFYFAANTMKKKFSQFMGVFFISIFAKLVIAATIVMVFKSDHDTTDAMFILPFAIIYFSFLFFETIELVKLSRKTPAKNNSVDKTSPKP